MKGARPIKASKKRNYRGKLPTRKNDGMIYYESLLERDYARLLEFDPLVEYYESQPMMIRYQYKGKVHKYFPDFKVVLADGSVKLVEVKPKKFQDREDNLVKFSAGKLYCNQNEWTFEVVNEETIRNGHIQYNLKKLTEVDFDDISKLKNNRILEIIDREGIIEFDSLCNKIIDINITDVYRHVFYLIYNHKIYTDIIKEKISAKSLLKVVK